MCAQRSARRLASAGRIRHDSARRAGMDCAPPGSWFVRTNPMSQSLVRVVLVISDDESSRELIRNLLQRAGYPALTAASRAQGMEVMRKARIDIVVADGHLTVEDDVKLRRAMEKDDEIQNVPVIAIAGEDGDDVPAGLTVIPKREIDVRLVPAVAALLAGK